LNPRRLNDDLSERLLSQLLNTGITAGEFMRQVGNIIILNKIQMKENRGFPMRLPPSRIVEDHPYEKQSFNGNETDPDDADDRPTDDDLPTDGDRRPATAPAAGKKGSKKVKRKQPRGAAIFTKTPMGHASMYDDKRVLRGHNDSFRRGANAAVNESKLPRAEDIGDMEA